jgi:arginine/lysine/ornithine decarboxylase
VGRDPGKIVIVSNRDISNSLRDRFGIELEMAAEGYSLAMTSLCDGDEDLGRLAAALEQLNWDNKSTGDVEVKTQEVVFFEKMTIPKQLLSIRNAYHSEKIELPLKEAQGRIAADFIFDFPPGIPFLVPGEVIEGPFKNPDRIIKVVKD